MIQGGDFVNVSTVPFLSKTCRLFVVAIAVAAIFITETQS